MIEDILLGLLMISPFVILFTIIDKLEIRADKKNYERYLMQQDQKKREQERSEKGE